jgi:hypothetical protein
MNALMQPFPHLLSTVVEITVKSTFMISLFDWLAGSNKKQIALP